MDRTTPMGSNHDGSSNTSTTGGRRESAATPPRDEPGKASDKDVAGANRPSESGGRAVHDASQAAASAAEWASGVADRAGAIQTKALDSASAAIREKPL